MDRDGRLACGGPKHVDSLHLCECSTATPAAQATAREHWESQGEKNPHSAAHYGIYAFKPRLALSFVDEGVDPYTSTSVWLEAHRQNDFLMRPAQDATAAQRIGALTAAQVLQHLVPLLHHPVDLRRAGRRAGAGHAAPSASALARGAVLAGVYLAYFAAFVGLSLAVSAWARSGRTALVVLLAVWVVNGLVAPRVAVDLSRWIHPSLGARHPGHG